jgi:ribulose 1,5-bisphosphate synthetase/thiazole synthase
MKASAIGSHVEYCNQAQFQAVVYFHGQPHQIRWRIRAPLASRRLTSWVPSSLSASLDCDACVIGGGIAGLTVAYSAAREGLSVIVLEDGEIGSGETGHGENFLRF